MLYVFLVDTGTSLSFDMNLALETVANLKEVIFRACKVPPDKQVLLISGGQSLDPSHRVCSYSAGTDTNPIFLFSKSTIESSVPPSPSVNFGSAQDLKDKVEACLSDRETTYQTVAARALLAQQLHETAKEITHICEELVHDQHMQQQGWSAVVANLEDLVLSFKGRTDLFEQTYQQYLSSRDENMEVLGQFWEDLSTLANIPVLPCLLNHSNNRSQSESTAVRNEETEGTQPAEMSLLDWIHSNDDENTNLNVVADHCTKALEQMDHQLLNALEKHIEGALSSAERPDLKEIGGLGERLYGLEQLLVEARKKVQEQSELAQALLQNQQRARNLNDASILPDLCASHRQQLKVMLRNDEKLRDIRSRCSRAKEELSTNLHARLRWIMFVQRQIADVDSRLVLQHENLRRLRRHFDLLRQLHLAPSVYLRSIIEVVRRRLFAVKFSQWATTLAGHSATVHQGESVLRKNFGEFCEGHFLTLLFPGVIDHFPPSFATSPPPPFDTSLPQISSEDLERLKNILPTLWAQLDLPKNLKDVVREPPILEWLHSSIQKLSTPPEIQVEPGVLPSLTAALLSPPVRPSRSNKAGQVKRSQSDFYSTDILDDASSSLIRNCEDAGLDVQRLEETIHNQRCRLLAMQSHLQCSLESTQAALPAFRNELTSIRQLTLEWRRSSKEAVENIRTNLLEQTTILLASVEADWLERLEEEKDQSKQLEEENRRVLAELQSSRREIEEWKERSVAWELEKKELIASAQLVLSQREKELERFKDDQLADQQSKFQQEMEAIQLRIQIIGEEKDALIKEWQSASDQENPEALREWRKELMLGHEMELEQMKSEKEAELEQLKTEKDAELNSLLQLQNEMGDADAVEWRNRYQALLKESQVQRAQLQEDLQRQHRMEMEGLRSRFRIMASASLRERSPSDSSLEKLDSRATPPASPRNPLRIRSTSECYGNADDLLMPLMEKLKREKEKVSSLIDGFRAHCKATNVKPTQWEETLSVALRESNQMMQNVGTKMDQIRFKETGSGAPITDCSSSPAFKRHAPLTSSLSQSSTASMAASVAVLQSTDDKSPPPPAKTSSKKKPMSKLTRSLVRQGSANVYGCEVGDAVVVQWDERYSTHILYNKGPYLHFLHADSIVALGLLNAIEPFLARVVQREFCLVRKEENRYNLPKGTNFYRVKVEKLPNNAAPGK